MKIQVFNLPCQIVKEGTRILLLIYINKNQAYLVRELNKFEAKVLMKGLKKSKKEK